MLPVRRIGKTRSPDRVFAVGLRQAGYTVVELVVVMVVMGILAANAVPRFFTASRFEEMGYTDELLAAARYAQTFAIAGRCDTRLEIDADGYDLWLRQNDCDAGAFTRPVSRPGAGSWSGESPSGVSVASMDIYFDAQGRPHDTVSGVLLASPQVVAVGGFNLTVEHTTGYAHTQ